MVYLGVALFLFGTGRQMIQTQLSETYGPEQISVDMEFASEGAAGPHTIRGVAARCEERRQQALARQDGVEQCRLVMAPSLENSPPANPDTKWGSWVPDAADKVISSCRG